MTVELMIAKIDKYKALKDKITIIPDDFDVNGVTSNEDVAEVLRSQLTYDDLFELRVILNQYITKLLATEVCDEE